MKYIQSIIIIVATIFIVGCGFQKVEYTDRTQLITMPDSQFIQLGLEASEQIKKENEEYLDKDKVFLAKVQTIGNKIAKVANKDDFEWEFHTISKDVLNAFCLPGGKVFVYAGIQKAAKNDDQLAAVISHEIAHALAQHGAERASMNQIVGVSGQLLSILISNQAPGYEKGFATVYGYGAQLGLVLPYSRTHELEADKIGLILMSKAGYNTQEAVDFWQNMGEASGKKDQTTDFFSTHPTNAKRINQIEEFNRSLQ